MGKETNKPHAMIMLRSDEMKTLNQSRGVAWHLSPSPLQADQSCAFYMLQNPGNRISHI